MKTQNSEIVVSASLEGKYVHLSSIFFNFSIDNFYINHFRSSLAAMSSQKGNVSRSRPQKHQNRKVFKNDLHDTNIRTKRINQIQIIRVCDRCKAILEWKIKYKKYKLLKSPKACNKCGEKAVKQPYHTICQPCADQLRACPKCVTPFSRSEENANENDNPEAQRISSNYE